MVQQRKKKMFARSVSALAAAALSTAALAASPALAGQVETSSVVVSFADLNLGQAKGMASLESRLRIAARQVCDTGNRDTHSRRLETECREQALSDARTEVAAITRTGGGRTEVALARR
jgi:UrcA family protein